MLQYFRRKIGNKGVHIIKRWGAGFWSDVDHVVGQLVAAEAMGRTPLVIWGCGGPYGDEKTETFTRYFKPLIPAAELGEYDTFYPGYWNRHNIADDLPEFAIAQAQYKVLAGNKDWVKRHHRKFKHFYNRREQATVSIFHESIESIQRSLPKESRFRHMTTTKVRKTIIEEKLRLNETLMEDVKCFRRDNFGDLPVLAIHLRGTDKSSENAHILRQNEEALNFAERWLLKNGGQLFLMTDTNYYSRLTRDRFGNKVVEQNCYRTNSDSIPNFLERTDNGFSNGREIIIDTYVAAQCDFFIGNSTSNVAKFVIAIGNYAEDRVKLMDKSPSFAV